MRRYSQEEGGGQRQVCVWADDFERRCESDVQQSGADQGEPVDGIGAKRLIGEPASVIEAIPGGGELGLVRVDREEWRAQTVEGTPLAVGTPVRIVEVRGTRVLVHPNPSPQLEH